ncbi:enoyl-CoA hydratase-related protein [uncultured Pseudokineococcus sp.]|uniref:enoyl-CoA hydratase-related protein n=1 Tax=uncultured Pseudokineococcus sp. TaxID=1642928 RepID=UPI00261CC29E|nr:enoyl-CoA hydratase-related protein [uncultured Pseudokineococcus sp.]
MTAPLAAVEHDGAVARVVVGRPEVRGALDAATRRALLAALREVAADAEAGAVRCVVLTGAGDSFCAGQDLREHAARLADGDAALGRVVEEEYAPLALLLAEMPAPVVAAVRGTAAGAGAALALAADLRLLAASARIDLGFSRVGLPPDTGTSWWLPRLVGEGRARDLLLLPRPLPAAECAAIGLATEAVDDDALDARVTEVAQQLAAGPTAALVATRRALAFAATHDLAATLEHEGRLVVEAAQRPEHRAAVEAFLRRRR